MYVAVDQVGKNLIDCCVFLLNSIVSQYHFTFETVKYITEQTKHAVYQTKLTNLILFTQK